MKDFLITTVFHGTTFSLVCMSYNGIEFATNAMSFWSWVVFVFSILAWCGAEKAINEKVENGVTFTQRYSMILCVTIMAMCAATAWYLAATAYFLTIFRGVARRIELTRYVVWSRRLYMRDKFAPYHWFQFCRMRFVYCPSWGYDKIRSDSLINPLMIDFRPMINWHFK